MSEEKNLNIDQKTPSTSQNTGAEVVNVKQEEKSPNSEPQNRESRFNRPERGNSRFGSDSSRSGGQNPRFANSSRRRIEKRKKTDTDKVDNIESSVIQIRRVSKTVKGGRTMRFSALIVAGDKNGKVGFGLAKGLDFQDAVTKATRKAKESMIKININDDGSIAFPVNFKYKSARIYMKPALAGTGLIAGGFLRPVLQLAGIQNIYSKIIGTTNKVVGVRAAFEGLTKFYKSSYSTTKEVAPVPAA